MACTRGIRSQAHLVFDHDYPSVQRQGGIDRQAFRIERRDVQDSISGARLPWLPLLNKAFESLVSEYISTAHKGARVLIHDTVITHLRARLALIAE